MKKNFKLLKVVSLACAIIMLATSFAACGSKEAATDEDSKTAPAASTASESSAPKEKVYDKKITFTMNAIDADKVGKNEDGTEGKVFKWLKEKFNFEIEWIPVTWSDYHTEKPQIWMASGEQPDIMMLDIAPPRYPMFLQWVKDGQLRAYPSLDNYPNMKKALDQATNGKKFVIDGKLMAWPAINDAMSYGNVKLIGMYYRTDWAEKLGLRQANDEYTWEQWLELCRAILAKDPGGNGAGKTIAMMGENWHFPRYLGTRSISPHFLEYTKKDGKWVWGAALPETLTMIKEVKKLYDEGLIWKDQPMVKSDDPKNNLYAGKLFSMLIHNANYSDLYTKRLEFKNANPDVDVDKAFGVAAIKAADGKLYTEAQSDHWTETAMSKDLSDEKAERWLDILEYLVSEEGYYMRNCGIPGEDFKLNNGQLEVLWPKNEQGLQVKPSELNSGSWQWSVRAGCSDAIALKLPTNDPVSLDTNKRLVERYSQSDVVVLPYDVELNYFNAPNYSKVGNKEKEIDDKIDELMVSKNLEADWNKWIKQMESVVAPVLEELNNTLK